MRAQKFVMAVDAVDDDWSLALSLNLKLLDLKETGGVRSMCRLDVVTNTPVPLLVASPDAQQLNFIDISYFTQS